MISSPQMLYRESIAPAPSPARAPWATPEPVPNTGAIDTYSYLPIVGKLPRRAQLTVAWVIALSLITLLALLRHSIEAEYAFASAIIIPVLLVTWAGGIAHGILVSILAASLLVFADILSDRAFIQSWIPITNGFTRLATYCFIAYLTARVRTLLQREVEFATRDPLTGLLNRRAFMETGETAASRAARYAHPMTVVFLDLDNFKQLNDTRGHSTGDKALKAVGAALAKSLRSTDDVARLGGDEFAILLHEINEKAANQAGQKIAAAVASALAGFAPVSASIGVAWFERPNGSFQSMIQAADALMYDVKHAGKNGLRVRSIAHQPAATVSSEQSAPLETSGTR